MRKSRQRSQLASQLLKQKETKFEALDLNSAPFIPDGMTRAYKNNRYTVMVYDRSSTTKGFATKVLIQNHFNLPISNHWSEINRIKNEIFGEETTAVEYYPAQSELVNTHNIYWIWIFPNGELPIPTFSGQL